MNKKKKHILIVIICLLIIGIIAFILIHNRRNDALTKEEILAMDSTTLLTTLEDRGLQLPPDYQEHRETAEYFVSKYTPLLIKGDVEVEAYVLSFSYDQSNQMMDELIRVLREMNLIE